MMSAGLPASSMTRAIVYVLPLPVTPSRVWARMPAPRPEASFSMACGWSPVGWYPLFTWKLLRVSIQVPPVEIFVDLSGLKYVLDVFARLLERDILPDVETLLRDPGVHLALPGIIRGEHEPLIAQVAIFEVAQVPGPHPQIHPRVPVVALYAAALSDERRRLRQQLHEAVGSPVRAHLRPEAALGVDHGGHKGRLQIVRRAHLPNGTFVLKWIDRPSDS